jgi:16S rRNA (guanine966-N2)-methyltransferase
MRAGPHGHAAASITAGTWKGRKLRYPAGTSVRPTMRRTKESLFSSLGAALTGSVFVDLYAGAGAIGIEALSRGARMVHFVEAARDAVRALRENLAACGADPASYAIHQARVADLLADVPCPFADAEIVFADPPYTTDASADLLAALDEQSLPALTVLVVEHRVKQPLTPPRHLRIDRERRFGDTVLTYLVPATVA